MSHDPRQPENPPAGAPAADKFETHYRQQLSALVDGELAPDEARFLLRRLEHDGELAGRLERWQLCGDVLRGQVRRAADPGLAGRVAAAIAAAPALEQRQVANGPRNPAWLRWGGGGAALAASVAVVAMLVGRPAAPDAATAPALARQPSLPATEAVLAATTPSTPVNDAAATREVALAAATGVAAAGASARPAASVRSPRVATASARTRPAPPSAEPAQVAIAQAGSVPATPSAATDPFASATPLQARPWPRAALPQSAASGYAASLAVQGQAPQEQVRTFYPFDPLQQPALPDAAEGADPAPDGN